MKKIPFNIPYLTGNEIQYIYDAVKTGKISGNGKYTQLCHNFFENRYEFNRCFLTSSCTDALEMAAILLDIESGDEVIMPSYTFVSTANAFVLRGAKIVFADSAADNPNIDGNEIEPLVTPKTKAIVVVHYAGIACDMDKIMEIADKYNLFVVEDAAQAIDSFYTGEDGVKKPLGSIGHLAAFSFHETKNIIAGEGGMLVVNDKRFSTRAEIIWEKGTNRSAFFRGEIDKYNWVDIGSSFLPSEVTAAFLWAQLQHLDDIQRTRIDQWQTYKDGLADWAIDNNIRLPTIPQFATNNAHMFYLVCNDYNERGRLIDRLQRMGIFAIFHYQSLHSSPYYRVQHGMRELPFSDLFSTNLVRLPMYYQLEASAKSRIIDVITSLDDNI